LINTSNNTYYNMLKKMGFGASILPIFGDLPIGFKMPLPQILNRNEKVVGVFFGNLQENGKFIEKVGSLKNAIEIQLNKQLVLLHIGNNRNTITVELLSQLSDQLHIKTVSLGFLGAQDAANILYNADIGLSNYPVDLIQKSGSIGSMLYNELPVILLASGEVRNQITYISEVVLWDSCLDLKKFVNQNKDFSIEYDPKCSARDLEQSFLRNMDQLSTSSTSSR